MLPTWLTWGRIRSVLEHGRRIAELDRRVSSLEKTAADQGQLVQELQRHARVRPVDLQLREGIWWARIGEDETLHPFCPGCAAGDEWAPLIKITDERGAIFECPRDHHHWFWRSAQRDLVTVPGLRRAAQVPGITARHYLVEGQPAVRHAMERVAAHLERVLVGETATKVGELRRG